MRQRLLRGGRFCKRAGLVLCTLLVAASVLTLFKAVEYGSRDKLVVGLSRMSIKVSFVHPGPIKSFAVRETTLSPRWLPVWSHSRYVTFLLLPTWIPLLVIGIPTAYLWWCDRQYPASCCQKCAYNLTGNTSGVCPECGEPTATSWQGGEDAGAPPFAERR